MLYESSWFIWKIRGNKASDGIECFLNQFSKFTTIPQEANLSKNESGGNDSLFAELFLKGFLERSMKFQRKKTNESV